MRILPEGIWKKGRLKNRIQTTPIFCKSLNLTFLKDKLKFPNRQHSIMPASRQS
ncbi:hypothetical protein NEIMUCOT_06447 [Neisseria mucosa ATCC 25996]|uniref:Uncharacterized protein n=1 Tax=Neisseria mucosa (strain ATCC 25996 / DSM 4631 / NCTC 10774 / M26) TaxID=546266 RepID=D3A0L1_NEIM2|nr:hypothetical protein NEIMUCOT_06447 [Neisseria mucosa ATCC 25996]